MNLEFRDTVLLVEDTPSLSMVYQSALEKAGLTVMPAFSAREALTSYRKYQNKVILLDLMLPDGNGLDILREIHTSDPAAKVLVITANGSINRAVEAMRAGAFDFLVKPFDDRRLMSAVENAIKSLDIEAREGPARPRDTGTPARLPGFIGTSPVMLHIYDMIQNIGRSTATVFITGESGTGKEVAAQSIHASSTRRDGPFVPINCGAIPKDLLESEVFGHLKGSFTGAISDKIGAAAAANGGTLFLDEVCEMDLALQTKLLRFLQTSMIQPVGAVEARKIDVRIVCATNRDPMAEVQAGRFREDLFYRLHVVPIIMPPLRERGNDVIEIAEALLERFSREEGKAFSRISVSALEALRRYGWPGNVRQLQNALRNAVVLNDGRELTVEMLPAAISEPAGEVAAMRTAAPETASAFAIGAAPDAIQVGGPVNGQVNGHAHGPMNGALNGHAQAEEPGCLKCLVGSTLAEVEREFIEATIRECDGSIPRAARILDVSPSTLYRKREAWERAAH